jgi:hypothetical protein
MATQVGVGGVGDIFVMPVTGGDMPVFGAPAMIHHGASRRGGRACRRPRN